MYIMGLFKRKIKDYIDSNTILFGSSVQHTDKNLCIIYTVKSIFGTDELEIIISNPNSLGMDIRIVTCDLATFRVYNVLDTIISLGYCTTMSYNKVVPTILTILREHGIVLDHKTFSIEYLQDIFNSLGGRL